jgi:beta-phosphoglucomutase-like phosphatase (HAD superfamily)
MAMAERLVDLVVFDCDGVLVDSEPVTHTLIQANPARHGLPLAPQEVEERFLGGTLRQVGEKARAAGAELPDDWLERPYEEMHDVLRKGVPLIDGVVAFLDALDAAGGP